MKALAAIVLRVNLRHVFERPLRTVLTIAGVAGGVSLVVSIAVINTTLLSAARATARQFAGAAEIEVAGADDRTGLKQQAVRTISATPGVRSAIPVLRSYSTASGPAGEASLLVLGVTPEFTSLFPRGLGELGRIRVRGGFGGGRGLVLADQVAESVGVSIGDEIELDAAGRTPRATVTGIVSGGPLVALNEGRVAAMSLPAAQSLFARPGRVDSVYVITEPDATVDDVERALGEQLHAGAVIGPPGTRAGGFDDALDAIATLTSLAATVALFVSAFVVFNTVAMSVAERRREVSMVLALGAERAKVFAAFLGEAAVLGSAASALGLAGGVLLAHALAGPALDGLRVFGINAAGSSLQVGVGHLILGLAAGVVVSVLGAFVPARRILKVAPVESLRPEGSYEWAGPKRSRRRTLAVISGTALLAAGVALGLSGGHNLGNQTWVTNGALVLMLTGATLVLPSVVVVGLRALHPLLVRAFGAPVRLGIDALLANSGRTTVTTGALVFTLGIVVGVGSALSSFESQWHRSAAVWWGAPVRVQAQSYEALGADQPLRAETAAVLDDVDGVAGVYAARYRVVNIGGRQTTMYVVPYAEQLRDGVRLAAEGEEFRAEVARHLEVGDIVISAFMAEHNDLEVGDRVAIPTPRGARDFEVAGIFSDLNPLDSLYMGSETFLSLWEDDRVDAFEVALEPGAERAEVMRGLAKIVRDEQIPATVSTREEIIGDVFQSVSQTFSVARGIQLAALIVAALVIANTMFIATLERRWEIGLQRAVGMARQQLARMLLFEATVIGLLGGALAVVIGLIVGLLMVADMQMTFSFAIPFEPSWSLVALALGVGTGLAALAGLYPTRLAVRVPIVEALRYE